MLSVWEINQVLLQEKGDFFAVFPWFWSYFFSRGYSIICCPIVPLYQPRIECSQGRHLRGGRHVWSSRWHDQGWISHQGLFYRMCDLVLENEKFRWFQQTAWIQATTRTRLFFERQGSWKKNTRNEQIVLFTWCFKYIWFIEILQYPQYPGCSAGTCGPQVTNLLRSWKRNIKSNLTGPLRDLRNINVVNWKAYNGNVLDVGKWLHRTKS